LDREKIATQTAGERLARGWRFQPPISKLYLELLAPTANDNASDLARLTRALKNQHYDNIDIDFSVIRNVAAIVREANWEVTATIVRNAACPRLIKLEPGDTRSHLYSLAFDIGTTAVRGQLLDLNKGRILSQTIDYNGQISFGADVISRIVQCQKPDGRLNLQRAVVGTINTLIGRMTKETAITLASIDHIVIAANTVMIHLLLGLDPQHLRLSPYVPAAGAPPLVKARSLGIDVGEQVYCFTVPSVASYVGGDIVAGVVGTGIYQRPQVTLYLDIGTNGEIVAGNCDWLVTAAASAGPTFEGGGIKHGMLAISGAIEDFELLAYTAEPGITTIGHEKPKGICGSGLINIAAELLRNGLDGWEYVLVWAADSFSGQDIVITEVDLDNLIRAKAAIFAGCQTLLKSIGGNSNSIDEVIIAGTFGSRINIENAITIGLLPDLPRDKFIYIGNGSLLGARLCSFSNDMIADCFKVAALMTNIELSENNDFMENYVAALFLPHTNTRELFPSVKLGVEP
jgi:uncharacterized 2Fe-2S/4Fe-4S cluster protein (DUF4445 family)